MKFSTFQTTNTEVCKSAYLISVFPLTPKTFDKILLPVATLIAKCSQNEVSGWMNHTVYYIHKHLV